VKLFRRLTFPFKIIRFRISPEDELVIAAVLGPRLPAIQFREHFNWVQNPAQILNEACLRLVYGEIVEFGHGGPADFH